MASQQYDIFAVTIPASDADFYVTTTKPTGAADLTLAATIPRSKMGWATRSRSLPMVMSSLRALP